MVVGLLSAIFGALTARVQTDIKSALAFASLTQVRNYCRRNRLRSALYRAHSYHWARLPADASIAQSAQLCFTTITRARRTPSEDILEHESDDVDLAVASTIGVRSRVYRFAMERGYFR